MFSLFYRKTCLRLHTNVVTIGFFMLLLSSIFSCLQKRDEACFAFAAKSGARNIQERTIIVDHSFDHRAVKVESIIIIIMGLYHVVFVLCVVCV